LNGKNRYLYLISVILLLGAGLFLIYYLESGRTSDKTPDISALFSPGGGISRQIIREIDNAQSSVDVAVYSFTGRDIAKSLLNAQKRGVNVRIILDGGRAKNSTSSYILFRQNNMNQKLVEPTMHNKFAIIDEKLLITGSYNWTVSAEKRNFENILSIRNSPAVVKQYKAQFDGLWRIGKSPE
jgi:phosphatidylserine/phosphatidylglycerophosphate/cardiolipin synthase-like enzyme